VGGIVANNTYRADFIYNNIMIQSNVIHSCWKYGVKKLLFLGSTCIYPKNAPQPLKEEYLLSSKLEYTNEPYAIAKIAGLKMCEAFNIQYGTDFIAVMPTNLYGSGDNYNLERSHVLPALMRKIHLGKCLEDDNWSAIRKDLKKHPIENVNEDSTKEEIVNVLRKYGVGVKAEVKAEAEVEVEVKVKGRVAVSVWGTGAPYREFMYSEDMAQACVYIMENVSVNDIIKLNLSGKDHDFHPPHFINIGTGEEISIKDLAYKIKELVGFKGEIVFDISKPDGTMRKATDTTILKQLGFKHKFDLNAGLAVTYEKYRSA
jgi:GDP-L-fucose synthase